MKKILLIFFVLVGFGSEINAGKSENSETPDCILKFSDLLTEDEGLIIDDCVKLLNAGSNEQKTVDGKHWLLLNQLSSLSFLESKMTQQSKKDNEHNFNVIRHSLRQDIQLLRDEQEKQRELKEYNFSVRNRE